MRPRMAWNVTVRHLSPTTQLDSAHLLRIHTGTGLWFASCRIEKYRINDAESSNLPNYVPGSFFLAPNDLDYRGNVAYVRASYHW